MKFIIVTGLSGAGKNNAIRGLEDLGYFCVDNLPPTLISKFAEACNKTDGRIDKIALVIDIRGGEFFDELFQNLTYLKTQGFKYEILYLDASDEVLIKRYKESRRKHPLALDGRVTSGIVQERNRLRQIKDRADHIIDTSHLSARELKEEINNIFGEKGQLENEFIITVLSFGFKYGIPLDSDLVFDVRFLPNPFYIAELKQFSGNDEPVRNYVLGHKQTIGFVEKLEDMLVFLIPNYMQEGKKQLVVSIGCTGGRHRSVAIANEIQKRLKDKGYKASIEHRDVNEDINKELYKGYK